jgi:catechol 2,3-dioxygenase-like lactoylglutathione lyase family enzyme
VSKAGENTVTVELNHTIIDATDKRRSAEFLSGILGVPAGPAWGRFIPISLANGVTLDFMDSGASPISAQHYAFLVSEAEFDLIFERIRKADVPFYADPVRNQPGQINHRDGGRGVYFDDPDRHLMEVITRPYGSNPPQE